MSIHCMLLGLCALGLGSPAGDDPLRGVARNLAQGAQGLDRPVVAVLGFRYPKDGSSSGSLLVRERLTTHLAAGGTLRVVERSLIDELLRELRLEGSGAVDADSTQRLGKLLGARVVVVGTLHDRSDGTTEVHARLLDAQSGAVLAAASAVIARSWWDAPVHPVAAAPRAGGPVFEPAAAPEPPRRRARLVDEAGAERFFEGGGMP